MPINLAGGYAAGGVKDALLDLVKQRMLEQELAQREEENQFQRLRANRQDTRQEEQDRIAADERARIAEKRRYDLMNSGLPQADINAALGEDMSTAHVVPTTSNPNIPGGGPSYGLPAVPIQSKMMSVDGMQVRPRSKEMQLEDAEQAANAKAMNTGVSLSPGEVYGTPKAGVMMRGVEKAEPWTPIQISVNGKNVQAEHNAAGQYRHAGTHEPITTGIGQDIPDRAPVDPLTHELLQGRLDEQRAKLEPYNVDDDVNYSMSGKPYVSAGDFTGTAREKARADAHAKGIPFVSAQVADSMRAGDTARANLDKVLMQVKANLAPDAMARITQYPDTKLSTFFQTDAQRAAFLSWRVAAIQSVQALAEKGMGFRLNQNEIDLAIENDIPQLTDSWATARQRVANLNAMLDSKEDAALQRDRRSMVVPGGVNDKGQTAPPATPGKTPTAQDLINKARSGRGGRGG